MASLALATGSSSSFANHPERIYVDGSLSVARGAGLPRGHPLLLASCPRLELVEVTRDQLGIGIVGQFGRRCVDRRVQLRVLAAPSLLDLVEMPQGLHQ